MFFEGRANTFFQFIQKSSQERFTEIGVVKMLNNSPETVIGEAAFGKKAMDMWIPFQRSAKSVQDADETRDKVSAFIQFMEHSENDAANGLKKTVKEGTVTKKERA